MKILALILTVLLTGCATMFSQNSYHVPVMSEPSAYVTIVDAYTENVIMTRETPFVVTLSSKRSYLKGAEYVMVAKREGYVSQQKVLKASLSYWVVGDILLDYGIISYLCVDANTGNIWNLDEEINFCLEKE